MIISNQLKQQLADIPLTYCNLSTLSKLFSIALLHHVPRVKQVSIRFSSLKGRSENTLRHGKKNTSGTPPLSRGLRLTCDGDCFHLRSLTTTQSQFTLFIIQHHLIHSSRSNQSQQEGDEFHTDTCSNKCKSNN